MRFDDSLKTVLANDGGTGIGAQATWRQLVDLVGRGRADALPAAIERLRALRPEVPTSVRAASARALAFARPPAALVTLFAEDDLAIAAPVLRTAVLPTDDWLALLPTLTPQGRSVLRHRRDLADTVVRGLDSLGSVDFVLSHDVPVKEPAAATPVAPPATAPLPAEPVASEPPAGAAPLSETPFQPVSAIVRGMPVVAEALRVVEAEQDEPSPAAQPALFEIADLVARIDAFQRERTEPAAPPPSATALDAFRFETDAAGTIRWVDAAARAALVGISLAHSAPQGLAQVDGVAAGGFRGRARFIDARLAIEGESAAAGAWRLTASPIFDAGTGRFTGYRGQARRPRPDEIAEPRDESRAASESLRQLVHELRSPTNAIAGFAELIETQLLGPVAPPYREQAGAIRTHTMALLGAIDDLDTAARIAGHALDLRPSSVAIEPLVARILSDLAPLARLRGAGIAFNPGGEHVVRADDRAVERLIGRLLAALVSASRQGERLRLKIKMKGGMVAIQIDRPATLASIGDDALLAIDAEEQPLEGAPLLGIGFAMRLARNLAGELGGGLTIGADRLTLKLPAAWDREMGQAAQ